MLRDPARSSFAGLVKLGTGRQKIVHFASEVRQTLKCSFEGY